MEEQGRTNSIFHDDLKELKKMIETLTSQLSRTQRPPGHLPGQTIPNPKEDCKVIVLRSGLAYEGPKMPEDTTSSKEPESKSGEQTPSEEEKQPDEEIEMEEAPVQTQTPSEPRAVTKPSKASLKSKNPTVPISKPEVSYPERLAKAKKDRKFRTFLDVLKQLHVTIPFTHALTQMPSYAKFLKDILTNKRRLEECGRVTMTEEASAVVTNKVLPKLQDPGRFAIPCTIGKAIIKKALCDSGASISLMPRSIYDKTGLGELRPTSMCHTWLF